ncbi:MAG: exosome complex RNA-binding protein Rrp4 [Candidatus Pacearchaeota archaeon]
MSEENEREIVVPGEVIESQSGFIPGDGTRSENNEIVAQRFGIVERSENLIKVIPLSGVFIPRRGNVIIGKVEDITFNGWITDIDSPLQSFLPVSEIPRYLDKNNLSEFLGIGDFFCAKIKSVSAKSIDLTMDGRGLGKLEGGIIYFINPNKVPRVIGKEGSMIKIIKDATDSKIVVGQNGIVWIRGENVEAELLAKKAILFVTEKSFVHGLTDKVQEFLNNEKGEAE